MKDTDIIGFHRRLPPFRGIRMDWRRFPALVKKRELPPPALSVLPDIEMSFSPPEGRAFPVYIDPDLVQ